MTPPEAAWAWTTWLRTRKWDYWATLTSRTEVSAEWLSGAVRHWLAAAQTPKVYAAFAIETSGVLAHAHAHVLVGGIGAHPERLAALARGWAWGHLLGSKYDPRRDPRDAPWAGACAYLSKHPEAVQLVGRAVKYRPRRKADAAYSLHINPHPGER